MRISFSIFIIIVAGIFLSNCNKFEDGRNLSIRSVDGRLIKGSPWIFEKLEVDGIDKSDEFRSDSAYFDELIFSESNEVGYGTDVRITRSENFEEIGRHYLINKNKIIKIGILPIYLNGTDFHNYGPIFLDDYIEWRITRITMNELQIKTTFIGKEYKLFLKSNRD